MIINSRKLKYHRKRIREGGINKKTMVYSTFVYLFTIHTTLFKIKLYLKVNYIYFYRQMPVNEFSN